MTFSWRVFLVKYYIFGASFLQSAYSDFGFSKQIQVFIYHFLFKGLVAKIQDCIARLTTVPLKLCQMKYELCIDFIILKTNYISYLGLYLLGLYCYSLRAIIQECLKGGGLDHIPLPICISHIFKNAIKLYVQIKKIYKISLHK